MNLKTENENSNINTDFSSMSFEEFCLELHKNKNKLSELLDQNGFIILKNTPARSVDDFKKVIGECLQWDPSYTVILPKKITQWIRGYFSKLTNTTQYREYIDSVTMKLGSPESSIQGPHIEGGSLKNRSSLLSMFCLDAESGSAQTGIYDLSAAFESLNQDEKSKYECAYNEYRFHTRQLHPFEKYIPMLLFRSFAKCYKRLSSTMDIIFKPTRMVVKHPRTKKRCLQIWPFLKNTSKAVHRAASEVFVDRVFLQLDSTASHSNSDWNIIDKDNNTIPWSEGEKTRLFKKVFKTAHIHSWSKGDILLIDNIRCAHGRMEGEETKREIIQLQCNYLEME
ncbi:TauD/TfdA family dioxygenase [Francisellaceae bacterium]|nr:TauD/TfdA family dioxygenase [Francisellaceae bacterium]